MDDDEYRGEQDGHEDQADAAAADDYPPVVPVTTMPRATRAVVPRIF